MPLVKILNLIIPLYFIIGLGYALKRIRLVEETFAPQLNQVVYYLLLPLLLFYITYRLELGPLFSLPLFLGFPLIVVITTGLAGLAAIPVSRSRKGAFIQGAFRTNLSYLGLPICVMVLGTEVSAIAALLVGIGAIVNAIISMVVLEIFRPSGTEQGRGKQVKALFLNPLLVAILVGFVFSALKVPVPAIITNTISLLSKICLPTMLLVMGLTLSLGKIKEQLVLDTGAGFIKLVLMPVIGMVVMKWLAAPDALYQVTVIMTAMPTAVVSHTFAKEFKADEALAGSLVNFSTLGLIVTLPLILVCLL